MNPIFLSSTLPVLGCFLLSGCLAPKALNKPTVDLPQPANWESNLSTTDPNLSTEGWASELGGEHLHSLIEQAWAGNPSLAALSERVIAQGEQATILGARLLPGAELELTGSRFKRNGIGFSDFPGSKSSFTGNSFTSGLNISWELDLWGKLADSRDSAKKLFEAGNLELQGAQISLAGQVAKIWYEVLEGTEQVALARKSAASFAKNQIFVEERFEKGLANALDQSLAQAGTASAKAKCLALEGQLDAGKRRLNVLLGKYPSSSLDQNLTRKLSPLPALTLSIPSPVQTLAERPDLLALEKKAVSSGLDLAVARKNFFPSLSLSGGPGSRSDEFENLLDNNFRTWGINGSFAQPIFNGGRLRAAHRQSKALQQAAWADYRNGALNAFIEVENLLASELRLAEEESLIEQAARAAEEAARLSWERYQRGVEAIFNALENQRRAFDARSRAYLIRKQRLHNRIDLHLALGQPPLSK